MPVAFLVMTLGSMTDTRRPRNVEASLLALHAPEGLGLEPAGSR